MLYLEPEDQFSSNKWMQRSYQLWSHNEVTPYLERTNDLVRSQSIREMQVPGVYRSLASYSPVAQRFSVKINGQSVDGFSWFAGTVTESKLSELCRCSASHLYYHEFIYIRKMKFLWRGNFPRSYEIWFAYGKRNSSWVSNQNHIERAHCVGERQDHLREVCFRLIYFRPPSNQFMSSLDFGLIYIYIYIYQIK